MNNFYTYIRVIIFYTNLIPLKSCKQNLQKIPQVCCNMSLNIEDITLSDPITLNVDVNLSP